MTVLQHSYLLQFAHLPELNLPKQPINIMKLVRIQQIPIHHNNISH